MTLSAEILKLGERAVREWVGHHPHDTQVTLKGVDLIVREIASTKLPFGQDRLSIEVVVSPENKLTGVKIEAKADHCKQAREECYRKLTDIIAKTYHK